MSYVDTYLQSLLTPRLLALGLNQAQRTLACADVRMRLTSLLANWHDDDIRLPALVLGYEEATFWEPQEADLDLRALVAMGVRNSVLADLHDEGAVLPSIAWPGLLREAVSYFADLDAQGELEPIQLAPKDDLFRNLARRFPNAWTCLHELAVLSEYTDERENLEFELDRLRKAELLSLPTELAQDRVTVIAEQHRQSAMDASVKQNLVRGLQQLQYMPPNGRFNYLSLTQISRNPEVLLGVLDHILRHGAGLVTANYVLTGDYLAKRTPLARQAQTDTEALALCYYLSGLSPTHERLWTLANPA